MFNKDKYRIIFGRIKEIQSQMIRIEFDTDEKLNRVVNVPKDLIKSEIKYEVGVRQKFKIPTWYLKRNRVIPLVENYHPELYF
ncbi:MAG: hypothetical protein ACTSRZ_11690 [Promethearchaeota archaeon]